MIDHGQCKIHSLPVLGFWGCEKSTRKRDPVEGDVYTKDDEHRRVLSIGQYHVGIAPETTIVRKILYSNGGDHNHWMLFDGFRDWMTGAQLIKDGTADDRSSGA